MNEITWVSEESFFGISATVVHQQRVMNSRSRKEYDVDVSVTQFVYFKSELINSYIDHVLQLIL